MSLVYFCFIKIIFRTNNVVEAFHRGLTSWFDGRYHPQLHKMLCWMYTTDGVSYATLLGRLEEGSYAPRRNIKVVRRELTLKTRMEALRNKLVGKPYYDDSAEWLASLYQWVGNYPGGFTQMTKDMRSFLLSVTYTLPSEFIPQKKTAKSKKSKGKKKK